MGEDTNLVPIPELPEHIGVVVRDIDQAIKYLSSTYTIQNLKLVGDYTPDDAELLAGGDFAVRIATLEMGKIKLELLQPINEKSILAQFLKTNGEGLHHLAFWVPNFDEVLAKFEGQGVKKLLGGYVDGKRWIYMDTGVKPGGIITEFMEFKVGGD